MRLGDDFHKDFNLALNGENFHALKLELGDFSLQEVGVAIERAFGHALVRLKLPHHPRILPDKIDVEEGAVGKLGNVESLGGGGGGVHGVVSLSAYILAYPITRATTIALFFSLFSVVEIGRNKASPPIFWKFGPPGFWETARGGFFQSITQFPTFFLILNLSLISPLLFSTPLLFSIPPLFPRKRERFPKPRKTSTRKKITGEFLRTLFRR